MKLNKITVNGTTFLGTVSQKGKKTYLKAAMPVITPINREDIASYVEMENANELVSETFTGNGTSVGEAALSPERKLDLKVCRLTMAHAKSVGPAGMENKIFNELLGK